MCGLCGVAGSMTLSEVEAFKELLYVSSLRGMDSTGIGVFTRKNEEEPFQSTVIKDIGSSARLLENRHFDKAIEQTNKRILMGHTRSATVGDVRVSNAHPFEFDKVVGAHNGTINYSSRRDIPYSNYFETDSEGLISAIEDNGVTSIIPKIEGAWALTLVNKQNGTLQFLRNKERDLCFCYSQRRDILFWASEPGFLRFIASRKNIKLFEDKVFRFNEDILYTYKIPEYNKPFEDAARETVKGKEYHYNRQEVWKHGRFFPSRNDSGTRRSNELPKQSDVVKLISKHNLKDSTTDMHIAMANLPRFHEDFYERRGKKRNPQLLFKGWNKGLWNEHVFKTRTKHGCAFCEEIPVFGDNVVFCRQDAFLCPKCSGDEGIEEAVCTGKPVDFVLERARDDGILYEGLNDNLPIMN